MVKNQFKDVSNKIIAGTAHIDVPKTMIQTTKSGKFKEFNTLTKTGKISTRNKQPVIIFDSVDNDYIKITHKGDTINKLELNDSVNQFNNAQKKAKTIQKEFENINTKIKSLNLRKKTDRQEFEKLKTQKTITRSKLDNETDKLHKAFWKGHSLRNIIL